MAKSDERQEFLFDVGPPSRVEPALKRPRYPVWTENKAKLIQTYLRLFVMITKHGVYIDGFTGPQEPDKLDTWAAKLVLETRPRWLRKFYLFEQDATKVQTIGGLIDAQPPREPKEPKRRVEVFPGDMNVEISKVLDAEHITQKEATFCLLDQRTFECDWLTVEQVANYKQGQNKIEIFYFVPVAWLNRAISGLKEEADRLRRWWGREDWTAIREARGEARARLFEERFREDLGYASAKAWPIFESETSKRTMYYMVHATDHDEAPKLMSRAYNKAVRSEEAFEQTVLEFNLDGSDTTNSHG